MLILTLWIFTYFDMYSGVYWLLKLFSNYADICLCGHLRMWICTDICRYLCGYLLMWSFAFEDTYLCGHLLTSSLMFAFADNYLCGH